MYSSVFYWDSVSLDMLNRVKSAAELEEEMLAKMPKFKARPLPKKVTGYPTVIRVFYFQSSQELTLVIIGEITVSNN